MNFSIKILFTILSISIPFILQSQIVKFEKVYGGTGYDYGYSVLQSYDHGYVIAGSTTSYGIGNSDAYVIKTDSLGNSLWQKTFGGINIDQAYSIKETAIDSGFVVAGFTNSFGHGGYDIYVIKTNKTGDTLWTKTYGGSDWDFGYSIEPTTDGGYIIAGGTYSFGKGNEDMYIVKTDSTGDTLWTKTYGGINDDEAKSIKQTNDGGYILTGITKSFGDVNGDIYVIKTNSMGDTLWTKTYGSNGNDESNQIIETSGGGYMLAGYTENTSTNNNEAFILKTNINGDTIFTKKFGSPNDAKAYSVYQTSDGNYVWTGKLKFGNDYRIYLYKIDYLGNWIFSYTIGTFGLNEGRYIEETTDKGLIVVGNSTQFNNGLEDIYLFKADSNGVSSGIVINLATNILSYSKNSLSNLSVYPNPVNESAIIKIKFPNESNDSYIIHIMDAMGREIKTYNSTKHNSSEKEILIEGKEFSNGIYFIQLVNETITLTEKFIVQH